MLATKTHFKYKDTDDLKAKGCFMQAILQKSGWLY